MFLEIQLYVIKSGCHPDSWWQSEERRIKKPADVSCVGTDLHTADHYHEGNVCTVHDSIVVLYPYPDYLVVV